MSVYIYTAHRQAYRMSALISITKVKLESTEPSGLEIFLSFFVTLEKTAFDEFEEGKPTTSYLVK